MEVIEKQIKHNITKYTRKLEDIKYVVVHGTGNTNKDADAEAHYNYFNNSENRNSSADFFVDEDEIIKVNDYMAGYTWHCGDGKGKYGATNKNSIGIEICVNGDVDKAIDNTILLCRQLISKSLKHAKIVRHYDASRKLCPDFFVDMKIKGYNKAYIDFMEAVYKVDTKQESLIAGINVAYTKGLISSKSYWRNKTDNDIDIKQLFINCNKLA